MWIENQAQRQDIISPSNSHQVKVFPLGFQEFLILPSVVNSQFVFSGLKADSL